jgi:hypothetical protein
MKRISLFTLICLLSISCKSKDEEAEERAKAMVEEAEKKAAIRDKASAMVCKAAMADCKAAAEAEYSDPGSTPLAEFEKQKKAALAKCEPGGEYLPPSCP